MSLLEDALGQKLGQCKTCNMAFGADAPAPKDASSQFAMTHPGAIIGIAMAIPVLGGVGLGWLLGKTIGAALLGGAFAAVGAAATFDHAVGPSDSK